MFNLERKPTQQTQETLGSGTPLMGQTSPWMYLFSSKTLEKRCKNTGSSASTETQWMQVSNVKLIEKFNLTWQTRSQTQTKFYDWRTLDRFIQELFSLETLLGQNVFWKSSVRIRQETLDVKGSTPQGHVWKDQRLSGRLKTIPGWVVQSTQKSLTEDIWLLCVKCCQKKAIVMDWIVKDTS